MPRSLFEEKLWKLTVYILRYHGDCRVTYSIYQAKTPVQLLLRCLHLDSILYWGHSEQELRLWEMLVISPNPAKGNFSQHSPIPNISNKRSYSECDSAEFCDFCWINLMLVNLNTCGKIVLNFPVSQCLMSSDVFVFSSPLPLGNFLRRINAWNMIITLIFNNFNAFFSFLREIESRSSVAFHIPLSKTIKKYRNLSSVASFLFTSVIAEIPSNFSPYRHHGILTSTLRNKSSRISKISPIAIWQKNPYHNEICIFFLAIRIHISEPVNLA